MARDFEDIHDIDDLNGEELKAVVLEHLSAHNGLDVGDLTVQISHGTVILAGNVGTDGERLIAEHVVTDVLGIENVQNDIFVDPTLRATLPEDVNESTAQEDNTEGLMLGDRPAQREAEDEEVAEDLDAELNGTTDVRKAIEEGTAWIPPESPTQEGFTDRGELGENH